MRPSKKRFFTLLASLPILVFLTALLYQAGMAELEGHPREFWDAMEWAAETITTTGYGRDADWTHPLMVAFVISVQFLGVFVIFMIIPVYLMPFLEERFESRLPRSFRPLHDHVVIFRYGAAVETLVEELQRAGVSFGIIEPDAALCRQLVERDLDLIHATSLGAAFRNSHLDRARAIVANGTDEENVNVLLVAQQLDFTGEVLALVEDPRHRQPMVLAGAHAVFTPRHALGEALAVRASRRINPRISGLQQLGAQLQMLELRIDPASPLAGLTLAAAALPRRYGVTIIGQWANGRLELDAHSDTVLKPKGILIALGSSENLDQLVEVLGSNPLTTPTGPFVIAGYGEVGKKVGQLLTEAQERVIVIDQKELPGVDIVGDVLDSELLESAHLDIAQGVVLALDSDMATLFAAVILHDIRPELPLIARVNQVDNVDRIHRAGVDFVLSISQVSGQILSRHLLKNPSLSLDSEFRLLKTSAPELAGRHPATSGVRQHTGCSVVAIERNDHVLVEFDKDFRFESDDTVYVCGSQSAIERFTTVYQ